MKKVINITLSLLENDETLESNKEVFEYNLLGFFAGTGDWNRNKNTEILNEVNDNKFDKNYFKNNINTLHRLPNLTLSRDKLSTFKEECNFSIVRDKDKADICVIGEKTIDKLMDMTYKNTYEYSDWKNFMLKTLSSSKLSDSDKSIITNIINKIGNEYGEENLICQDNRSYWYDEDDANDYVKNTNKFLQKIMEPSKVSLPTYKKYDQGGHYTYYIRHENNDTYTWINDNKHKLIKDTQLNKLCVEDSVILTKEEFQRLTELVNSKDEDNVNVGLAMMANCNVEKSKTELSLLFAFYHENMKSKKVWNHVNFKYLRKLFEKYINMGMGNWGASYDNLIKIMCQDKCLTLWSSRFIANAMFKRVLQQNFGAGEKEGVFTLSVDDLKLKSEYECQLIDENDNKLSELIIANYDLPF